MADSVLLDRRGAVMIITINRPEVRNAINAEAAQELSHAIDELEADERVEIAIFTGRGKFFCAGADLKAAAALGSSGAVAERGPMGICAKPPTKLSIAAIEGGAAGGGFEIALACDLIVAAKDARLGLPEVRHNLVAVGGGLLRLPRRIPPNVAAEVALTGDLYPASFFHRHGLVNRLTIPGQALDEALDLAAQILRNGPGAVAATTAILRTASGRPDGAQWEDQASLVRDLRESTDRTQGIRAFREGRQANYRER